MSDNPLFNALANPENAPDNPVQEFEPAPTAKPTETDAASYVPDHNDDEDVPAALERDTQDGAGDLENLPESDLPEEDK